MTDLVSAWALPFHNVREGDRFVIVVDDATEPAVWQSAISALDVRGADVTLVMYPVRGYHCADPTAAAIGAAKEADVVIALTSTALNSGTPGLRAIRSEGGGTGKTPVWLMEQCTSELLRTGGATATWDDIREICDLQRRVGEILDQTTELHITTDAGTDLVADISGMPPGYFVERWTELPFQRDPKSDRLGGGTWPFGEIHAEPVPGQAHGTVVWDVTAHHPPGRWSHPVALTIDRGEVTKIEGAAEADCLRRYLAQHGDEASTRVGGEIALGTNHLCLPTASMRSEKKRVGAMHFGIGHGADRGVVNSRLRLEGIVDRPTVTADGRVICEAGRFVV